MVSIDALLAEVDEEVSKPTGLHHSNLVISHVTELDSAKTIGLWSAEGDLFQLLLLTDLSHSANLP